MNEPSIFELFQNFDANKDLFYISGSKLGVWHKSDGWLDRLFKAITGKFNKEKVFDKIEQFILRINDKELTKENNIIKSKLEILKSRFAKRINNNKKTIEKIDDLIKKFKTSKSSSDSDNQQQKKSAESTMRHRSPSPQPGPLNPAVNIPQPSPQQAKPPLEQSPARMKPAEPTIVASRNPTPPPSPRPIPSVKNPDAQSKYPQPTEDLVSTTRPRSPSPPPGPPKLAVNIPQQAKPPLQDLENYPDLSSMYDIAHTIKARNITIADNNGYFFLKKKIIDEAQAKKQAISALGAFGRSLIKKQVYDDSPEEILKMGQRCLNDQSGQCDHMAAAVIAKVVEHIHDGKSWTKPIYSVGSNGHTWLIMFGNSEFDLHNPDTWGRGTIVIDSWLGCSEVLEEYQEDYPVGKDGVLVSRGEIRRHAASFKVQEESFHVKHIFSKEELYQLAEKSPPKPAYSANKPLQPHSSQSQVKASS